MWIKEFDSRIPPSLTASIRDSASRAIPKDCNRMSTGRRGGDTTSCWIRSSKMVDLSTASRATSYRKTTADCITIPNSITKRIHPRSTRSLFRKCFRIVLRHRRMRTCPHIMVTASTFLRHQSTSSCARTRRRAARHFRKILDHRVLFRSRSRDKRKTSSRSLRASRQPLC